MIEFDFQLSCSQSAVALICVFMFISAAAAATGCKVQRAHAVRSIFSSSIFFFFFNSKFLENNSAIFNVFVSIPNIKKMAAKCTMLEKCAVFFLQRVLQTVTMSICNDIWMDMYYVAILLIFGIFIATTMLVL